MTGARSATAAPSAASSCRVPGPKKSSGLSYCDVRERYEHFRARCTDEKPKLFKFKHMESRKKKEKEKGCTEPLYGKKSKCVMNIVPQDEKVATLKIDDKCIKWRT